MDRIDLHEAFIKVLCEKKDKRSELVDIISDVLRIERESASRRLSGKVQFSAREIGLVANELGVSLDALIHRSNGYQWIPFSFEYPMTLKSMDVLCDKIEHDFGRLKEVMQQGPVECGGVFNSLPLEFYIYYPFLAKFMFFKWGYYYVGTGEFDKFSSWEMPKRLMNVREQYDSVLSDLVSVFYIWDEPLIWSLINEIAKFHTACVITTEEKDMLKRDLKELLKNLELYIKGLFDTMAKKKVDMNFYVSTKGLGFDSFYLASDTAHLISLDMNFLRSPLHENKESFLALKKWINSLREVSTLLSGSGQVYRRLFFENQYKIIDMML